MINDISQWASSFSTEAIIGSSALILTLATIIQTRRHNRLSVTPHLNTFLDRQPNGDINLYLFNNGIGPARITSTTVFIDGEPHTGDLQEIAFNQIQEFIPEGINIVHAKHFDSNYSILNGEKIILFSAQVVDTSLSQKEVLSILKKIHLLIKYKSFYRIRFKLDTRKTFWNSQDE